MSQSPYYLSTSRSADSAPRTPPHNFLHDDVAIASSDVDDPHSVDIDGLELPQPSIEGGLTLDPINERIAKEEQGRNFNDVFDPLLLAAIAAASGPHTTRHHYHHHYLRNDGNSKGDAWETSVNTSEDEDDVRAAGTTYNNKEGIHSRVSHAKAQTTINASEYKETQTHVLEDTSLPNSGASTPELTYSRSLSDSGYLTDLNHSAHTSVDKRAWHPASDESFETETRTKGTNLESTALFDNTKTEPVDVKCMVRARIPTPYGEAFLHLYHNSRDAKEHLAIVVDPAQLTPEDSNLPAVPHIRSKSLDAVWSGESEKDRIVRGAYVGRLSAETRDASASDTSEARVRFTEAASDYVIPPPLVRIHSECFTGETIGSLRCDCGEQLDEALRLIFQPQTIHSRDGSIRRIIPGRGAVIYMRQEGRGIGLLEKLRAYNLQDLGHDTVAANLLLGRGADERRYDVAGAILKDLGLGSEEEGVRLLTNNPDKVSALEIEGVCVTERVPMVPRSWRSNSQSPSPMAHSSELFGLSFHSHGNHDEYEYVMGGATQIGGFTTGAAVVRGTDLDKYLRTKVLKMGHMLSLPPSSTSPI